MPWLTWRSYAQLYLMAPRLSSTAVAGEIRMQAEFCNSNHDGQELKQSNAYDQIGENQYLDVPKKNSRNGFAHSLPKERASVLVKGKLSCIDLDLP